MPDFAKRHREAVAGAATHYVAMHFMRWSQFELFTGMPFTMPTPHCVGCLMVFDDEAAAREWACGGSVLHVIVNKAAREGK